MQDIKKEFYDILSYYLSDSKVSSDYSKNKKDLKKIANLNLCFPFLCEAANAFNIEISEDMKNILLQIVAYNYRNLSVQTEIITKLSANNIPCAVIKGTSISVDYPNPILRPLGDVDLLVPAEDYEKSIDLLIGCDERNKLSKLHKFHYQFFKNGISIEIHKYVSRFDNDEDNIKEYMGAALKHTEENNIDGFNFPVLKKNYQAITLLLHTKRHYFENKLNLRMLCDWAMFIDKTDVCLWNNEIYPTLERLNLNKWADALSGACNQFINIACDDKIHSFCDKATTAQLANEFISDCISTRDIGIKKEANKRGYSLYNIILLLNDIATRDFKAAKCRPLLPLLWIMISIRYVYRRKIGLRGKINMLEYSFKYNEKYRLFNKINNMKGMS